jgi:hypothetical protein
MKNSLFLALATILAVGTANAYPRIAQGLLNTTQNQELQYGTLRTVGIGAELYVAAKLFAKGTEGARLKRSLVGAQKSLAVVESRIFTLEDRLENIRGGDANAALLRDLTTSEIQSSTRTASNIRSAIASVQRGINSLVFGKGVRAIATVGGLVLVADAGKQLTAIFVEGEDPGFFPVVIGATARVEEVINAAEGNSKL